MRESGAPRDASFLRSRRGAWRIEHHPELSPERVLESIARHRAHDAQGRAACEQWGEASSLSRVRLDGAGPRLDLAVKVCRWRSWRGGISEVLRGSRARRALRGARRLVAAGIPTAEPLALAERRRFGIPVESFFVARFVAGALPLPAAAPQLAADARRRRAVVDGLGRLVGALHASGIDHRDFKHSNFLLAVESGREPATGTRGPASAGIWLVDAEGADPERRLSWRRRVRALGQLEAFARDLHPWLPQRDRARFLRAYLEACPGLAPRRRELVHACLRWVDARLAHWSRRDRRGHHAYPMAPRGAAPRDARFTRSRSDAAR